MKTIQELFKSIFKDFESMLRFSIFVLISIASFFSVLSDRHPYNYINIAVYGILSLAIILYVFLYKSFKFDLFTVAIVALNLSILISQLLNNRLLEYPRTILLLSLFSIIVYQFYVNIKNKDSVFVAILFGGLVFAAFFVFSYRRELFSFNFNFSSRLGRDFSDQNDLSKYMAVFAVMSVLCAMKFKKLSRVFFIFSAIGFFTLILITGSISGLLCFLISLLLIIIFSVKRQNRVIAAISIISLVGIIVLALQLPFFSYFKDRIQNIFSSFSHNDNEYDTSAADRYSLFKESFQLFLTRPIFGFGYDQVQYYTHGAGFFAHNNFTELGASFGVFGLLIYEFLLMAPTIKLLKEKKRDNFVIFTSIFLFIFQVFLIIYRKKIEFFLMPLYFSIAYFGLTPYLEIKRVEKKLVFAFVRPDKYNAIDSKLKILNIHYSDEFAKTYFDELKFLLNNDQIDEISIAFDKLNGAGDYVLSSKHHYKDMRNLSFKIDSINPDVVLIDSKLLSFSFLRAIGFNKKIICIVREKINVKDLYKNSNVTYITFNEIDKIEFENSQRKRKTHIYHIERYHRNENVNELVKNKNYKCVFVGDKYLFNKYKIAVEYFKNMHTYNADYKFAIIAHKEAYSSLINYFKLNNIDYIDVYENKKINVKNTLLNSEFSLFVRNGHLELFAKEMHIKCGCKVISEKGDNSIVIPSELVFESNENDAKEMYNLISNENSPTNKVLNEDEFNIEYLRYEYMKVFML